MPDLRALHYRQRHARMGLCNECGQTRAIRRIYQDGVLMEETEMVRGSGRPGWRTL